MTGVIVEQKWESIVIVIPIGIVIPIVVIPWHCPRRVGHPFASTISG
jgi:hypothetical protein